MKKLKWILPALLVLSTVVVATAGACIKYLMLEPLGIHREESIIAIPFVLYTDDALRFMIDMKTQSLREPEMPSEAPEQTEAPTEETAATETGETEPEVTEPVYVELEESWFDDALFIGDSRTAGLKNYYRLGKADYFTNIGMNIYNVFVQMSSDTYMEPTLLEDLLQKKTYGKIYIGIGLNECNYEDAYIEAGFAQLVDMIKTHQPDAKIILQSIMMVSEPLAKNNEDFSHENLDPLNEIIRSFCDNETVFYIDYNPVVCDENGYLRRDLTHDGIHLYGTGYEAWALWIKEISGTLGIA